MDDQNYDLVIFRPSYYMKEDTFLETESFIENFNDLNDALKNIVTKFDTQNSQTNNTQENSGNRGVRSFTRAVTNCCLQLEMLIYVQKFESDNQDENIAERSIRVFEDCITYVAWKKHARAITSDNDTITIETPLGNKEILQKAKDFCDENNNTDIFEKFLVSLKKINCFDKLVFFNSSLENEFELLETELDLIDVDSVSIDNIYSTEKNIIDEEAIVEIISPVFKNDVRRKWKILFEPQIDEGYSYTPNEVSCKFSDKEYLDRIIRNKEAYKPGDKLISKLKYTVRYIDGDFTPEIKNVEILEVINHIV